MNSPGETSSETREEGLRTFAVALYARPGVAAACLQAQDENGVDVNLLLWAVWLAHEGQALPGEVIRRAEERCKAWRAAVLLPLRRQRRVWAAQEPRGWEYEAAKALELQAEFHQLAMLAQETSEPGAPEGSGAERAEKNLRALGRHYGLPREALDALLGVLIS